MKKFILFPFLLSSFIIGQSYVLNFDGSNDYLSVAASDNASTKLTASSEFTISAWVFIEGADRQQIIYNDGAELEWLGTSYNLFRMQPGAVKSVTNLHRYQWHHVVMTRNSSNSIQIYVNGDLSRYYVSNSEAADDILYIGRDPNQGEYFDGSMDEIAIWSTELSASQINTLYNNGLPESATSISGAASSLQSYWKLEQLSGSTAANSVTNGAALTLNNGPTWKKFKQSPIPKRMANIAPYSSSSSPQGFIEYNSKIYFRASDLSKGNEMWVYDPAADSSSTNPQRISDLRSGSGDGVKYLDSWSKENWVVYNNKLYFAGNDGTYGDELFSYDGSSFTRISDIYSGSNSSSPKHLTIYDNKLYFNAYNSDYGTELYVYDGTNVSLVKDFADGSISGVSESAGIIVYNNKLYFQGYASSTGYELYSYDGTDIALVKDIRSETSNSYPQLFTLFDSKLFFKADDGTIGNELFYYDGSTVTGIDVVSGSGGSDPFGLAVLNDTLYFEGYNSTYNWELFGYDGSKGARLIKDIYPGSSSGGHPHYITAFDNKLYFQATDGTGTGAGGYEPWYYDGNDVGRVSDIYSGSSSSMPAYFYATTKKLYFQASDGAGGQEPHFITSGDPFPSIASITSTTSDGSYNTGDAINLTVNFSEAVSLSSGGSMTVTLETGSTDRTVSITSISSATSASGTYTVQAGDVSSDLTVKSIAVLGTISDASDQAMVDFSIGANLASSSAIVVDGVAPTVASVKSTSTNTTYGTGASINITVNFSESVTLSNGGSMTVTLETGSTDRTVSITSISSASSASGTYTVVEGDASGDLSVTNIALSDTGATLSDAAGNAMSSFSVPADSNLNDFNAIVINTAKPSTPLGFAVNSNYGSVGLSWTAISSATGYKVYRSTSATSDFAALATTDTTSTYTDSPASVTRYYYYVMSVNNLGDSSPSDTLYGYPSKIWYVEMNGDDDDNDGKSKTAAFETIEKAVKNNSSLASGDTIYVGPSISSSKTRDQSGGYYDFGGISGGVTAPYDKDFVLIGTSGADSTIFNAEAKNRHFYFDDRGGTNTKIIGITFYRGSRSTGYGGGSISIRGSNAKMQFINCVFDSNRVEANYAGGAIEIRDQAAPSFTDCTFKNNWVERNETGASGGAIYISNPNSVTDLENTINFKQCKFIGNYAKGKYSTHGGAVFANRNTLFENCLFVKNGAIGGWGQSTNTWENARGGAIYSAGGWSDTGIITAVANCTFDSNYVEVLTSSGSPAAADIFYGYGSNSNYQTKAYVFNTVVTGSYNILGGAPAYTNDKQFKIFYSDDTDNRIYVDYSAIEGSSGQSWINDNVFDINPVYKNAADLDYSLSSLSPVIGQGTSSYKNYDAPTTDLLGVVRPNPSGSTLDMGAYESSLSSSAAPLPVTGIVGTAKTNSAYLSWSAIKDSLGGSENAVNIKYLIYQGGSQVGTSTSTTSTVKNLTNGTTYTFSVAAQDTVTSLIGAPSTAVSVKPVYSGPYWYVAASGGNASGYDDDNLGSKDLPLDELASAIQEAATGDTIVMLNGTHSGSGNRNIDGFSNKSLVIMGDPEYGAESTIINAGGVSRHFRFDDGEDSTNQVIGLTLYNGKATDQAGGSVYIWNANVVFKKVIFKQNKDESNNWSGGGAVFVDNSSEPRFYQCVFDGNVVDRTGTDSQGNSTDANGGAVGINHASRSSLSFILFDGCTFKNNVAKGNQRTTGGALYVYNSQAKIYNSLFYNNTAYSSVDGTNNSGAYGSAIQISGPSYYDGNEWVGGDVQIVNSTIVNNKVKSGASSGQSSDTKALAVILDSWQRQEKVWFFNNIVWGNQSENGNTTQQVEFWGEWPLGTYNLNYNVVQNSADIKNFQYDDSFETDPTFSDSTNGDYSLANSSSLIGKGGSSFKNVNAPTTDLLGAVRPNPSGSSPDIGAYENSLSTTPYPAAVTNLTAVGGSGSVTLSWNTVADADSAYKVYQHTSAFTVAAAYYVGATSAKTTPHDTTYTITGLDNTTRYYFRVSAVNKEGYEGTSSALDITPTYSGPVWWVSTTGNDDTGDGGTGKPFKTLKHAIEHVTAGDTVMLKKGTYTGDGNRAIEITANNSAIDFANLKNVVITSEEGAANTIIHANDRDRHFTISGNSSNTIDSTFQFIGLTFEGGKRSDHAGSFYIYANRNYDNDINMDRASLMQPKFKDCVFKDNQAIDNNYGSYGGAFWIENAAPIFENCVFDSNYANRGGGAINIGGGGNVYKDTTWIRNTTFKNNWADDVGTSNNVSVSGGAIWLDHGMNIIIDKSTFQNNSVIQKNANHELNGGAIAISKSWDEKRKPRIYITNSRFTKNEVRHENGGNSFGGAIYAGAPFTMKNTLIDSNKSGVTSGQGGNRGHGGGLYIDLNAYWDNNGNQVKGYTYLINNTIADNYASGNQAGEAGGIFINHGNETFGTWFNNIIWGNRTDHPEAQRQNLSIHEENTFAIFADYNDVEYSTHYPFFMGSNSYDIDPAFYSATNYQLGTGSPLIGAGASSYDGIAVPAKDILGNARPNPSGSNPDLGAYENALEESPYPKQVKNLVGTFGSSQVSLSWDANAETDIDKYIVYASTVKDYTPARTDSVGETTTTAYTVTGLTNNTEYHLRVAAVNKTGYEGSYSAQVSVIPKYDGPIWWVSAEAQTNSDGSKEFPFDNITSAIEQINVGDTIYLEPGVHQSPGSRGINANSDAYPEFYVHGSTGDPKDVVLDAQYASRHFELSSGDNGIIAGFKNITFTKGRASSDNNGSGGGAIKIYSNVKVTFDNCIFYRNVSEGTEGWGGAGGAILLERVTKASFTHCIFRENRVENGARGGAVFIYDDQADGSSPLHLFDHCKFISNGVEKGQADNQEHLSGGALTAHGSVIIQHSLIDSNYVNHNYTNTGEIVGAYGGAVAFSYGGNSQELSSWNNIPYSIFSSNIVSNTRVRVTGYVNGGSISASTKIKMENNLIINNSVSSDINQNGWDSNGGVNLTGYEAPYAPQVFINNTVAYNRMDTSSGSSVRTPGLLVGHNNDTGQDLPVIGNNIIYYNDGDGNNDCCEDFSVWGPGQTNAHIINNLFGAASHDGTDPVSGKPNFKNPSNGNYQLSRSSAAVDAGALSFTGGYNAPIKDIRGYYRVGTPDLGAYEAGASKYILTMADDIAEGDRDFSGDTTFVKFSQKLTFTVTTGDIDGNVVSSNEPVTWNVFPNQKYARVAAGADENSEGGTASATIDVTDQTKGKGFRFRVIADIGDAFLRSNIYVIEELVTGAPPPVANLTIDPSDWTNNPNFTLSWETPTWAAQRELIGAVVEVTDGISIYNQYLDFQGDTLTNFAFSAPEAGQFDASLRLIDELGNEDPDSSKSVTAYFDDIMPEEFYLHWPNDYVDENGDPQQTYTSDVPSFNWQARDDYPSGVKEWRLFLNDNFNYAYTGSDVNTDQGNRWVNHATAPLSDGYYNWYVEAVDQAGNVTHSSDTAHFGVDLSPPNITHSNPLTTVDENTTSPAINVTFSDAASGVQSGWLNYRRSGTGGGFVVVDLLSGPVNIPGSDIKAEGLEYFIETVDNVGNHGYWPSDTTFHSVRVRSEDPITTAQRWSSGIPGGTDSTNYLFFSIPFEVSNAKSAITTVMGPPDEFNYRLYAYNNGWQENPSSVTMGNAYFFIYDPDKYPDNPNLSFDFGVGVSTPTDPPYGVNVSSGQWKFFGSPYNFNVSLDNVYTEDGTNVRDAGSIYTWGGSWSSVSTLQPWRGYIYKSGGATKLNIDGRGGSFGKMAKVLIDPDNVAMDAAEWTVNIIATTGNARDELNAVGVRHMAKDGYDRLDEFEPPAVPGDVVLRIDNRDREESPDLYAIDIRKPNEQGHYWDLQVFTPTNGNRTYITFDGLGYIPQEYDVFLINKTTQQAKNLEWESSYHFANTGSDRYLQQDLRLVIGTKDFVNENNAGVNLYPDAFTLSQNYPNPFNPQTSIMISLEEDAQVDLVIYNLLGEQITRLAVNENRPAGYYTFIWNGTNDVGRKVSTGVYFYHAMIKNSQGRVVLNKTRKMIFLK